MSSFFEGGSRPSAPVPSVAMEKRVLLAVFLSFIVLYGYQSLFPPQAVPTSTEGPATGAASEPAVSPSQVPALPPAAASGPRPAPIGRITAVEPPNPDARHVGDTQAKDIVVETDAFRAVFSNRGGELVSWQLKHYLEHGNPVELIPTELPRRRALAVLAALRRRSPDTFGPRCALQIQSQRVYAYPIRPRR